MGATCLAARRRQRQRHLLRGWQVETVWRLRFLGDLGQSLTWLKVEHCMPQCEHGHGADNNEAAHFSLLVCLAHFLARSLEAEAKMGPHLLAHGGRLARLMFAEWAAKLRAPLGRQTGG